MTGTQWTMLFGFGLALASLAVWREGSQPLKGAAKIVVSVWLINVIYAETTNNFNNALLMAVVDAIAAWFILSPPRNEARQWIGVLYIAQCVYNVVYWVNYPSKGSEGPIDGYLDGLAILGWCQIAALLVGAFNDRSKRRDRSRHHSGGREMPVGSISARQHEPQ